MKKTEIARKFDEIVAFAEVEKFIDTPVKRYSSGMYVRLAFAVAAHLEPEILVVDEVLAVGDAQFQKKCLGKMDDVARGGRTVLFVSHNVPAVTRLCNRCILLQSGTVLKDGMTHEVMNSYLRTELATSAAREWGSSESPGNEVVRLRAIRVRKIDRSVSETFDIREPIGIDVVFDVLEDGYILAPNIHLFDDEGTNVFVSIDQDPDWRRSSRPAGRYCSTAWIPGNFMAEGFFTVRVAVTTFSNMNVHFDEPDVVAFHVIDSTDGDSARGDYAGHLPGVVRPILNWTTTYSSEVDEASPQQWAAKTVHVP